MKAIFLLAGAAALGIAAPAAARPDHGKHHGHAYGHANARSYHRASDNDRHVSRDSDRHVSRDRDRHVRRFARGQRFRSGYGTYYSYGRIPYRVRRQYDLNARYRYYYSDGYLYAVDPRTMLIEQVISALLR